MLSIMAAGCVKAGIDITMPGMKEDIRTILDAVDNAQAAYPLTKADLQNCAVRTLELVKKLADRK